MSTEKLLRDVFPGYFLATKYVFLRDSRHNLLERQPVGLNIHRPMNEAASSKYVRPRVYLSPFFVAQGKFAEASSLSFRSLAMREKVLGPEHPDVAASLEKCASSLRTQV